MASLWAIPAVHETLDPFPADARCDVLVVGAGVTGLTAAAVAAQHHARVTVIEAIRPGALTSGHSTGKVTLLQGVRLSTIRERSSVEVAAAYVEANRVGAEYIRELSASHPDYETGPAYSYATDDDGADSLEAERILANDLGIPVVTSTTPELPFEIRAAIRLDEQFMIDPMMLVDRLLSRARQRGVQVVGDCVARDVQSNGDGYEVETSRGTIRASTVIIATGTPFLNRGMHFARLKASRSFVAALRSDTIPLRGMYLSVGDDTKSLRPARVDGAEYLIVAGGNHTVGREDSTAARVEALHDWARTQFPGLRLTHSWAAQDYESLDSAPEVGPITKREDGILVATGFAKWGLAAGAAAGIALAESARDNRPDWLQEMDEHRSLLDDAGRLIGRNAKVAAELGSGAAHALVEGAPGDLAEGEGTVGLEHGRPTGTCRIDGELHQVSAVCPHLGGILAWNDAERSWDCPLHGSRFDYDGRRIEGPARADLRRHPA